MIQTQWRYDGEIMRGLDYAGVKVAAECAGLTLRGKLFDDLQIIEREILAVDLEKLKGLSNG